MPMHPHPTSFGVFKPAHHVLISFATTTQSDSAAQALREAGFSDAALFRYTADEMQTQAEGDIQNASPMASLGQDLNLVKAHLALARQGQTFVLVRADKATEIELVTQVAQRYHASRAQRYGVLITEELIPTGDTQKQTTETPDSGLDLQTPQAREVPLGPEADA